MYLFSLMYLLCLGSIHRLWISLLFAGSQGAGVIQAEIGHDVGSTLDRLPFHHWADKDLWRVAQWVQTFHKWTCIYLAHFWLHSPIYTFTHTESNVCHAKCQHHIPLIVLTMVLSLLIHTPKSNLGFTIMQKNTATGLRELRSSSATANPTNITNSQQLPILMWDKSGGGGFWSYLTIKWVVLTE